MTIRTALVTSCLALICGSATFAQAGPPVKVEVVVDDDEDFFTQKKPAPKSKTDEVRQHADEMFDDLSREEAKHKNDNTQVVNVVVVDGKKEQTQVETPPVVAAPATPETPVVPDAPLTRAERRLARLRERQERRLEKLRLRQEKLRLRNEELSMREDLRCQTSEHLSWWNRPSHAERGDVLVHGIGSFNGQGVFGGFGAEFMASDMMGIRTGVMFQGLNHDDSPHRSGPNFNLDRGGVWANTNSVDYRNLEAGHAHLIDASLALHVIPRSRFDIFPTVGFGYMGYDLKYADGVEKGGAGYLRLGAGFNIVIKRLYAGMDFGWYPVEVFHHGTSASPAQSARALIPGKDPPQSREPVAGSDEGDEGPSRFNAKRMTLTAHVGFRF